MNAWQPMETAPTKHLSQADLWVPGEGRVTDCTFSCAFNPPKWGKDHWDGMGAHFVGLKPTHWMPRPTPPGDVDT